MNTAKIVDIIGVISLALLFANQFFLGKIVWLKLVILGIMVICLVYKFKNR